ncbi:MAG: rhomboid family intramembrane serine protease [bacterium]
MRPWYRYSAKTDNIGQPLFITPFSKLWGYGAPVTLTLIIVNVAIWIVMAATEIGGRITIEKFWYPYFGMTPELVLHGKIYQLFTSIFLHSVTTQDRIDILHLAVNMYLLWVFGPRVERTFSSKMFFWFYIVTGIAGNIVSLLARVLAGVPEIPSIGASAAVFGILVAYGFLFANDIVLLFFVIPIKVWKAVVAFIIFESMAILFGFMGNVDHWNHLGGAAAAAIWMLVIIKAYGHKTAHGWSEPHERTVSWWDATRPRSESRGKGGFHVIINRRIPDRSEHPEGTDDDPPPDWFKL